MENQVVSNWKRKFPTSRRYFVEALIIPFAESTALTPLNICFKRFGVLLLLAAMLVYCLNVLWVLRLSNVPKAVWQAVGSLPNFVFRQFLGLFKMANPNKNFKHTEVGKAVSIEEILKK